MARIDQQGNEIKPDDVVENWQGRRCVAKLVDEKIVLDDDIGAGPFRTPVRVIGTTETIPAEQIVKQARRPEWYRR